MDRVRIDGLTIVAVVLVLFMGFNVLKDRGLKKISITEVSPVSLAAVPTGMPEQLVSTGGVDHITPSENIAQIEDPDAIASPYDEYILTQGIHGEWYGQMAIDISAGKGATIKSPINGLVTALFVDEYGNTNLIIENDHFRITMFHGLYSVNAGDHVELGQPVGKESNQGYTVDAQGRPCRGRNCGYHTHLNIYDKLLGTNVDPLPLIQN
jgi:murein DD-endopeptidase MepM/ murein hydrolase activator NlpD